MDKSAFFARGSTPKTQVVEIGEGESVTIRKLSQGEVETVKRKYGNDESALEGFRFIVSRVVLAEDGSRLFADDDQAKLAGVEFEVINTIANAAVVFSGLSKPGNA